MCCCSASERNRPLLLIWLFHQERPLRYSRPTSLHKANSRNAVSNGVTNYFPHQHPPPTCHSDFPGTYPWSDPLWNLRHLTTNDTGSPWPKRGAAISSSPTIANIPKIRIVTNKVLRNRRAHTTRSYSTRKHDILCSLGCSTAHVDGWMEA